MTKQEADAWKYETSMSREEWRVDPIHRDNPDMLVYKGGASGHYFQIVAPASGGAVLTVGTYAGAVPHIGDAAFRVMGRKEFSSWAKAEHFMVTRGGMSFLLEETSRRAFQPLGVRD